MNIVLTGNVSESEGRAYVEYLEKKYNRKLESLEVDIEGDYANLNYKFAEVPFERIRRITGYLVGTMDNWNDAKTSEEGDRVKHLNCENSEDKFEKVI